MMELGHAWRGRLATFLLGRSFVVFLVTGDQERKKHKKQGLHWRPHVPLNIFGGTLGAKKQTDEVNVSCKKTPQKLFDTSLLTRIPSSHLVMLSR